MATSSGFSLEHRARINAGDQSAMASPELRERISQRTEQGMAPALGQWTGPGSYATLGSRRTPSVSKRFLEEFFALACGEASE